VVDDTVDPAAGLDAAVGLDIAGDVVTWPVEPEPLQAARSRGPTAIAVDRKSKGHNLNAKPILSRARDHEPSQCGKGRSPYWRAPLWVWWLGEN
jgi:hypothetical protein